MKNVLFLASHVGGCSDQLLRCLDMHPRIQGYQTEMTYSHPFSLEPLVNAKHKCPNSGAVWADEILYNHQFSCKNLYDICSFLYLIREPRLALPDIVNEMKSPEAGRYYCYRLRRIYEMARRTKGAVFLTAENLAKGEGLDLIEEYLQLNEPLRVFEFNNDLKPAAVPKDVLAECQASYDRYLFRIRQLDVLKVD